MIPTDLQRIHQIDVRLDEIDRIFKSHTDDTIPVDIPKYHALRDEALKIIAERALLQNKTVEKR